MVEFAIGVAVGAFLIAVSPSVGRNIKSLFVKDSTAVVAKVPASVVAPVEAAVTPIVAEVSAEVKKI